EYLSKISSFNEFNGEIGILFSELLDINNIPNMDYVSHIFLKASSILYKSNFPKLFFSLKLS
ncbi:unnamed protein product, partial [marine sediment metagenome]